VIDVIKEARRLKSEAMDARDDEDYERAERLIVQAEVMLKTSLDSLRSSRETPAVHGAPVGPGDTEVQVAEQLGHILGSKGGIYRRSQNYEASARAYDEGYTHEKWVLEHGIPNSYDLVQRLIARAFINPKAVRDGTDVLDQPLHQRLLEAKAEVQRQLASERKDDEYAAADKALIYLLLGDTGWESALNNFIRSPTPPSPYAVEATLDVVNQLRAAISRKSDTPVDLEDRLTQASKEMKLMLDKMSNA
jgi:hypothetical protein